jgi:DNA-binding transcriptional LysR family regulator
VLLSAQGGYCGRLSNYQADEVKVKYIADLEIFVRVAELGSLTAAANSMDLSPQGASTSLKRLEEELEKLLFVRTTRSMRLTSEGERFLARCRPLLAGLLEAEQELVSGNSVISGNLQISMPSDLGRNVILRWLDEFQVKYPAIHLKVQISDRIANVFKQSIDLAIRYGIPPDSNMVALPLVPNNWRVLCASPDYMMSHAPLQHPRDLIQHNCLFYMLGDTLYNRWRFAEGDNQFEVEVQGNRVADDSDAVRRWAIDGHGICYRSRIDVAKDIAAGRLQVLCANWRGEPAPLYLLCADRKQVSPTVRLLREHLESRFREFSAELSDTGSMA